MKNKIPLIPPLLITSALKELESGPKTTADLQKTFNISEDVCRELCWRLINSRQVGLTKDWKLTLDFKIYIDA